VFLYIVCLLFCILPSLSKASDGGAEMNKDWQTHSWV